MRIGLFTDSYLPTINGISFVVESTRVELEHLGHEVYIFAPAPSIRYKESDDHIIRFRAIKGISYKDNLTSIFFPPQQLRKIRKLDLDVIHFFSPNQVGLLGIYAAVANNIPLVGQYCSDIYEYTKVYPKTMIALAWLPIALPVISNVKSSEWRKVIQKLRTKHPSEEWRLSMLAQAMRVVHNQCQLVIVPSKKMATQLKSYGVSAPIELLPNGVDALPIKPSDVTRFRRRFKLPKGSSIVLYVGRLGIEKNLDLLIDAFEQIYSQRPQTKLLLVGDFDHRKSLEERAMNSPAGSNIVFTGMLKHQQLGAIYSLASVFAFPSVTDTQGLVLHEAAHAGLPIVMVDSQVSEVLKTGKNGFLAKNQPVDFSEKVLKVLTDDQLAHKMGAKSRQLAASYTASLQTQKLAHLYRKLLS